MPQRLRRLRAHLSACAALLALCACAAQTDGQAEFVGRIDWPTDMHDVGGFSGFDLDTDGIRFHAVSDRGWLVEGRLMRDGARLVGIENGQRQPLRNLDGRKVKRPEADAEGLALGPGGRFYVSFEGAHRVWAYDGPDHPVPLASAPAFAAFDENKGLEALAIDDRGRLLTLPEHSGQLNRPFPVWRYEDGKWRHVFDLPRRGGFLPVGADFGPDGRFYLLERVFTGIAFRTRVRRFALSETSVLSEEILLETGRHLHGNLEGLAVWRDPVGSIRLTMVSDDNYKGFQRSEIVEYRVTD